MFLSGFYSCFSNPSSYCQSVYSTHSCRRSCMLNVPEVNNMLIIGSGSVDLISIDLQPLQRDHSLLFWVQISTVTAIRVIIIIIL